MQCRKLIFNPPFITSSIIFLSYEYTLFYVTKLTHPPLLLHNPDETPTYKLNHTSIKRILFKSFRIPLVPTVRCLLAPFSTHATFFYSSLCVLLQLHSSHRFNLKWLITKIQNCEWMNEWMNELHRSHTERICHPLKITYWPNNTKYHVLSEKIKIKKLLDLIFTFTIM